MWALGFRVLVLGNVWFLSYNGPTMTTMEFWQSRYDSRDTPWDLGGPSPHFERLLQQSPAWLQPPGRVAVLGAGRGHDAARFAQAGFTVVAFDYAPGALAEAQRLYGDWVTQGCLRLEQMDVLTLGREKDTPWTHAFDWVLEHTCFCAIHPQSRPDYVRTVKRILQPAGCLVGVFWEHDGQDGPPYSSTLDDVQRVFGPEWRIRTGDTGEAAPGRRGTERLLFIRRELP